MDIAVHEQFTRLWSEFFPTAELPLAFHYTDDPGRTERASGSGPQCLICALHRVRRGMPLAFDAAAIHCRGGRRYLGFSQDLGPHFTDFLSCGLPGEVEGERYKKSPELVEEWAKHQPGFAAPSGFIVFKRWDALGAGDVPQVVIFFAPPDVLSGVYTLANFDESDPNAVISPMGSGCSSIVYHPYHESLSAKPRAVLGMFDVSARPCVPASLLTLAIPWMKFARMPENARESFLITRSWDKVRKRIAGSTAEAIE